MSDQSDLTARTWDRIRSLTSVEWYADEACTVGLGDVYCDTLANQINATVHAEIAKTHALVPKIMLDETVRACFNGSSEARRDEADAIKRQVRTTLESYETGTYSALLHQEMKWGIQDHDAMTWLAIALEEFGEIAKAMLEGNVEAFRTEVCQTSACLVQLLAKWERREVEAMDAAA